MYVPTTEHAEQVQTDDGYGVRFLPLAAAAKPWTRFPVLSRTPVGRYVGQAANAAAFLRPLRSALAEDLIDVLCVQEYWTARFDVLARSVACPVVALDQGLPDRREIKLLKRGAFERTSGTVVQTQRQATKVGRYGGAAERIPNAVDTACSRRAVGIAERPTILCVGRLHDAQKRLSDVIRALALLPPTGGWRSPAMARIARCSSGSPPTSGSPTASATSASSPAGPAARSLSPRHGARVAVGL